MNKEEKDKELVKVVGSWGALILTFLMVFMIIWLVWHITEPNLIKIQEQSKSTYIVYWANYAVPTSNINWTSKNISGGVPFVVCINFINGMDKQPISLCNGFTVREWKNK